MARPPVPSPQQIPPVIDPDNVPETLCLGPFNVALSGPVVTLTFTQNRPEVGAMFRDGTINTSAVVRARIVIPTPDLIPLRESIDSIIRAIEAASPGNVAVTVPTTH